MHTHTQYIAKSTVSVMDKGGLKAFKCETLPCVDFKVRAFKLASGRVWYGLRGSYVHIHRSRREFLN